MPLMNRTGGTTGNLFVQDTEPLSALAGDLWSDTSAADTLRRKDNSDVFVSVGVTLGDILALS